MTRGALHDPDEEGAIILFHPKTYSLTEQLEAKKSTATGKEIMVQEVHVVIDPVLGRVLRPHQIEGVRFMWECVTGVTSPHAFGCIMADEMVGLCNTRATLFRLTYNPPVGLGKDSAVYEVLQTHS